MSLVTMIGFECSDENRCGIERALFENGFASMAEVGRWDEIGRSSQRFAYSVSITMEWWVAVSDGAVDFDRIYDISEEIRSGKFDEFCSIASSGNNVSSISVLLFDLGNEDLRSGRCSSVRRLFEWIRDETNGGGPIGSMFAWFEKVS